MKAERIEKIMHYNILNTVCPNCLDNRVINHKGYEKSTCVKCGFQWENEESKTRTMEKPNKKDYDFNDIFDAVKFGKDMIQYCDYLEANKENEISKAYNGGMCEQIWRRDAMESGFYRRDIMAPEWYRNYLKEQSKNQNNGKEINPSHRNNK